MSLQHANLLETSRKNYSIEEWYGCRRKSPMFQAKAERRAETLNQTKGDKSFAYAAYECRYCGCYHVGRYYKKRRRTASK